MQLRSIVENRFTDLARKLNNEVQQLGESELRDLVRSPSDTVAMIRRGALSKTFIMADKKWTTQFLLQWYRLPEETLREIFGLAMQDVYDRYESISQKTAKKDKSTTEDLDWSDEVITEGVGGFLWKLAKWTILIIQLTTLALVGGRGGYGRGRQASPEDLRILNPYAVFRLTKRLHDSSVQAYNQQQVQVQTPPQPTP